MLQYIYPEKKGRKSEGLWESPSGFLPLFLPENHYPEGENGMEQKPDVKKEKETLKERIQRLEEGEILILHRREESHGGTEGH
jgi:hypothetical protein